MARTRVASNGTIADTTVGLSVGAADVEYDVFLSNQGEGAMRVVATWTASEFSDIFIPPTSHRPRIDIVPGHVFHLDSNTALQFAAFRTGGASGDGDIVFSGNKTHVTAASTGNDYLAVGIGARN